MTKIDTNNMTITIDGTDLSKYINSVDISGGKPIYDTKKRWGNNIIKTIIGYNDWTVTFTMNVSENPSIVDDFITNFNNNNSSTIILGTSGIREITFYNALPDDSTYTEKVDDIMMADFTFVIPGMLSNRVIS